MIDIDNLAEQLIPHYSHFDVGNRLLFTGHSHQAWPDVALEGLDESFYAAARELDLKWEIAEEKTEILRNYLRAFYDDPDGYYCRALNTHSLLVSWLSSFDLQNKPKVITTDAEFHSMHRQLRRLEEEGLEVVQLPGLDFEHFMNRLEEELDDRTSAVMLSRVFFESSLVNPNIGEIAAMARLNGIPLLIDDYHGTNVVPLSLREAGLEDCYLLIGGYKYLQWGEGNCFLRFPNHCDLRPAVTGWFASFSTLDQPRTDGPVHYDNGNQRFASGTFDPASQFRAAKVVEFFKEQNLTPEVLRNQYKTQIQLMREQFLEKDLPSDAIRLFHNEPVEQNGGFLSFIAPDARKIRALLLEHNVFTDARGSVLRMGPAPYITTTQIKQAMDILAEVVLKQVNRAKNIS